MRQALWLKWAGFYFCHPLAACAAVACSFLGGDREVSRARAYCTLLGALPLPQCRWWIPLRFVSFFCARRIMGCELILVLDKNGVSIFRSFRCTGRISSSLFVFCRFHPSCTGSVPLPVSLRRCAV